jgi:hypothetical protein
MAKKDGGTQWHEASREKTLLIRVPLVLLPIVWMPMPAAIYPGIEEGEY